MYVINITDVMPPIHESEEESQMVCTDSLVSANLWDSEYIKGFDGDQSTRVDWSFTGAVATISKQVTENARTADAE
jgi:hypothetical protein